MKTKILLIFGGRSTEHEVSVKSAANVLAALDLNEYDVCKVYITKEGLWRYVSGPVSDCLKEDFASEAPEAAILPGSEKPALLVRCDGGFQEIPIDVALPVMHGKNGEDGTIQGLFEIARLPYVGCGVLASSVSMDKITTKRVVEASTDIRQADYVAITGSDMKHFDESIERIEAKLPYPVYVKPANAGSSIGVSKAHDRDELVKALNEAYKYDDRILVEENITGREIECAILGTCRDVHASGVGEILAAEEFYTYDAKYNNPNSLTVLDPDLPEETVEEIRDAAKKVFRAVGGFGLSRVDFFVTKEKGEVIFNEINTFPGYTDISMYPMLWKNRGIETGELMDRLIKMALTER